MPDVLQQSVTASDPAQRDGKFLAKDRAIFESKKPVEFEETFWSAAKQSNRTGRTFKRPMYDTNGDPQYLVCVTIDITDQKLAEAALADSEKRLRALATTDSLTDLPNRRQFLEQLRDERSSLVMIDIDHFKRINDEFGHAEGDAMLKHFAQLTRNTLRVIDTPGRLGGEEFAIILPGTGPAGARTFAERLREAVANTPMVGDGKALWATLSIGVATMDPRDSNAEDALLRSDEALYRAKRNGRNRVELAETGVCQVAE
jgi:diguanylate cyclase (GGDEF)-like protein